MSPKIKEEMWQVYRDFYSYTRESFMNRIAKNNYYALYRKGEKIVGFTGLRINEFKVESEKYFTIYFGQTVIDPMYRGSNLIQKTGIKLSLKFFNKLVSCKSFFWADALTYRSYLVFAKTLKEYYPTFQSEMPKNVRNLRDFIGKTYYPDSFCKKTGTVKKDQNLVADPSAVIQEKYMIDPDIAFFAKTNKHHAEGHGLLTLAPINVTNLMKITTKVAKRSMRIFGKMAKIRPMYPESPKAA